MPSSWHRIPLAFPPATASSPNWILIFSLSGVLRSGCAPQTSTEMRKALQPAMQPALVALCIEVNAGTYDCDVYLPARREPAPLVIVAHGFSRTKASMADWGRCLI